MIDEHWAARIAELLRAAPRLLATSVFELIRAEGYERLLCRAWPGTSTRSGARGSCAAPAASTRIVTAPGEECQFDWSDVSHWTREWGLGEVQCFSAILSLVEGPDLVVRPFRRPRAHLRGAGPVLRVRRRGAPRCCAPTGWGRSGTSQGRRFTPPSTGPRLRPVPRHRDPGLPGPRRQAQGQGGAPLPGREGALLGGVRGAPGPPRAWPSSTSGRPLARAERIHSRRPPRHRRRPRRSPGGRVGHARPPAPPALRHGLCRGPTGPCGHPPDRVAGRSLLGPAPVPRPAGRGAPRGGRVDTIEIRWAGEVVARHTLADPA